MAVRETVSTASMRGVLSRLKLAAKAMYALHASTSKGKLQPSKSSDVSTLSSWASMLSHGYYNTPLPIHIMNLQHTPGPKLWGWHTPVVAVSNPGSGPGTLRWWACAPTTPKGGGHTPKSPKRFQIASGGPPAGSVTLCGQPDAHGALWNPTAHLDWQGRPTNASQPSETP